VALFAQLGGGIYTKSADVGADLVGKIEQGIPEDDPRNPAVIADLVGDNVGDCAGRGADLFESTAAESIGAMILGTTTATAVAEAARARGLPVSATWIVGVMMFPLVVQSFGIVASIAAVLSVRAGRSEKPMAALHRGHYVAAALSTIGLAVACRWLLYCEYAPQAWVCFFAAGLAGIIAALMILYITSYYTEPEYRPTRRICEASRFGAAPNIIAGLSVGFECVALPAVTVSGAILTVEEPVDFAPAIYDIAWANFERIARQGKKVRLIGVSVSGFDLPRPRQRTLFDKPRENPRSEKQERLSQAIDRAHARFGDEALRQARSLASKCRTRRELG
jgi:K(+)-stimulated pyrophosphate-energized sodium pump